MTARGALLSFSDPVAGIVPSLVVPFQYNPAEVTRILRAATGPQGGSPLRVSAPPTETYAFTLELDALEAPDKALTGTLGIGPMLAAIEAMLEPGRGGIGALSGAVTAIAGALTGAAAAVPSPQLPLVVLSWSPLRLVPVRIDSLTVRETAYDAALQPVQASVEIAVTVIRDIELDGELRLTRVMAAAYQAVRTAQGVVGVAQGLELST
jgi:hypothetical protein